MHCICPLRRHYLDLVLFVMMAGLPGFPLALHGAEQRPGSSARQLVFFGTYTRGTTSKGVYVADFDTVRGELANVRVAGEADHPSFLAIHPNGKLLFCVNETADFGGAKANSGAVSAHAIDRATGRLTLLNQQPTRGAAPCHLVVDATGKWLLTANYTGGSICVHPIAADGRLGESTSFVQHQGKGANARRQDAPHAHSINLDAANRFAFVADLGLDKVLSYHFDAAQGKLAANPAGTVNLPPGSGPRHFAWHPNGSLAFTNSEILLALTSLRYEADHGSLSVIDTVSTLPPNSSRQGFSTAECQVHPSGKYVYVSNRGHDSIAVFRIDAESGRLTHLANESTQGKTPRNFCIDPTGTFLLAENQGSNTVVVFRIDQETGKLQPTGHSADVPAPVCAKFLSPPNP